MEIVCKNCNRSVDEKYDFCHYCGAKLEKEVVVAKKETVEEEVDRGCTFAVSCFIVALISVFLPEGINVLVSIISISLGVFCIISKERLKFLGIIGMAISTFVFVFQLNEYGSSSTQTVTETREEYIASCKSDYKYKDILRNPSDYKGQRIVIDVKIYQVHDGYYFANANDEYGWWIGDTYCINDKSNGVTKILDGDVIRVYGEIDGTVNTMSLIVKSEELVSINMKHYEILEE